jgi:hypothetical protein
MSQALRRSPRPRTPQVLDAHSDHGRTKCLISIIPRETSRGSRAEVFGMAGRKFGYSRVSRSEQDWSLQLDALTQAGVDDRDAFREKASGAKRNRTELRRMLDQLRPGDQATVYRLDRLARSQLHLLQIVEEIEERREARISDGQYRHEHGDR